MVKRRGGRRLFQFEPAHHAGLYANVDGIEDGILPAGWQCIATVTPQLLRGICDVATRPHPTVFADPLRQKTGVYRLTAALPVGGRHNGIGYSTTPPHTTGNRRDFPLLFRPKKLERSGLRLARQQYHASGSAGNGSQAQHFQRPTNAASRVNLNYVTNLARTGWLA